VVEEIKNGRVYVYKLKSSSRDTAALKGFSQYVQNKLVQISKIHTSY
jgi:hypothetical protein